MIILQKVFCKNDANYTYVIILSANAFICGIKR